jgi:hypothetical protein
MRQPLRLRHASFALGIGSFLIAMTLKPFPELRIEAVSG